MKQCLWVLLCCLFCFQIPAQVVDDPQADKKSARVGFFSLMAGAHTSTGNRYSAISYQHLIGHFGGDSYLGLEVGSMTGNDGYQKYGYLPVLITYTTVTRNPGGKKRFLGYGSIKIGSGKLLYSYELPGFHLFDPGPPPEQVFGLALNGGTQVRLTKHLYLNAEFGLGTLYTYLFGITIKL